MSENWFIIKNLEDFINASRVLVYQNFGTKSDDDLDVENLLNNSNLEDQKEMDNVLSYTESLSIATPFMKKQKKKNDESQIRYLINENSYLKIVEALNDRLVSNILNNLVNKGLIETAYDEKTNDFIFWVNEKTIGDNETNEQQF